MTDTETNVESSGLDAALSKTLASFDPSAFEKEVGPVLRTEPNASAEQAEDGQSDEPGQDAGKKGNAKESAPARQRDPQGKFAASETPPEPTPEAPAVTAPSAWSAQHREAFGKLPPEAQRVLLDLSKAQDADYTKKSQALAQDREFAGKVRSLISDTEKRQLESVGMNEVQGIQHLINLNRMASQNFPQYLRWAVGNAKVDPRSVWPELLTGTQQQPGAQPAPQAQPQRSMFDPQAVRALQDLNGRLQAIETNQRQSQVQSAQSVIDRFRTEKGPDGQPLHPFFDDVESDMTELAGSPGMIRKYPDPAERLKHAYDAAVAANADFRGRLIETEVSRRTKAQQQQAEVDKARQAAPKLKGPTVDSVRSKPKGLDAHMAASMKALGLSTS